jgi:hypothetical protein
MATTPATAAAPPPATVVEEPLITCSPFAIGYLPLTTVIDIPLALDAAPLMLQLKQVVKPEDVLDDLMWPIDPASVAIVRKIYNILRAR